MSPDRARGCAGAAATCLGRTAVALALAALAACAPPPALLPSHELLRDVHVRGPATAPVVALTFDDGPNGRCTADILDALAATGTPATFFVLGRNLGRPDNAALLARMARAGHTIGVHGWAHSTNWLLRDDWARSELARARAAVVRTLAGAGIEAAPPRFYRPPYGFLTGPAARAASEAGVAIVEWTVSVEDWRNGRTAGELAEAVVTRARPGDVVVLHDGDETAQRSADHCVDRPAHAEAVRVLVPALHARGLRVAPLAEVLALPASSH